MDRRELALPLAASSDRLVVKAFLVLTLFWVEKLCNLWLLCNADSNVIEPMLKFIMSFDQPYMRFQTIISLHI